VAAPRTCLPVAWLLLIQEPGPRVGKFIPLSWEATLGSTTNPRFIVYQSCPCTPPITQVARQLRFCFLPDTAAFWIGFSRLILRSGISSHTREAAFTSVPTTPHGVQLRYRNFLLLSITLRQFTMYTAHPPLSSTYDHRTLRTELPVRSAELKQCTGGLVVRWVTTGEYPLLYVFVFCFCLREEGFKDERARCGR
jgi:hypothetical protein